MTLTFFFAFQHQNSHLLNTTVTSMEHNCHIYGTQLPHLWNTTVTSLERNVLSMGRVV